ncbi:MAG TPA: TIGR02597 family protein [Prosthecobacter sp.]|nr:TIGR02597 family protein [Prosthecobacter sp.]
MKAFSSTLALFASLAVCPLVFAQNEAFTDPVGFVSHTVPAQSDAVLAVPLYRSPAFRGVIQSISSNVITVAGTPAWTANQFVQVIGTQNDTFAVMIASGAKEGLTAKITANGTNTLTVELDPAESLTGIKSEATDPGAADQIDIVPYWTPSSLLGSTVANGSRLLLFPTNVAGINLSSSTTIARTSSGWFIGATNSDHFSLSFGQSFVFRNQTANPQTVALVGGVPMVSHRHILRKLSAAGTAQDIRIGFSSPVPEIIGNLTLGFNPGDRLLVFDNSATGINKSASITLSYTASGWFQGPTNVTSTFQLQPGFGYIFRRASTAAPGTVTWSATQSYLQ